MGLAAWYKKDNDDDHSRGQYEYVVYVLIYITV